MKLLYMLIFCISSAGVFQVAPYLSPITQKEALEYRDEKIVYIGIGTYTDMAEAVGAKGEGIGCWQYLPQLMIPHMKKDPQQCACINFDREWTVARLPVFERYLATSHLEDIARKNKHLIRIVNDYISHESFNEFKQYITTVLSHGGVLLLGQFAPTASTPWIDILYNELCAAYGKSIGLFSAAQGQKMVLWTQGAQFSFLEDSIIRRFDLSGFVNTWQSNTQASPSEYLAQLQAQVFPNFVKSIRDRASSIALTPSYLIIDMPSDSKEIDEEENKTATDNKFLGSSLLSTLLDNQLIETMMCKPRRAHLVSANFEIPIEKSASAFSIATLPVFDLAHPTPAMFQAMGETVDAKLMAALSGAAAELQQRSQPAYPMTSLQQQLLLVSVHI